jgi:hypothetical protein
LIHVPWFPLRGAASDKRHDQRPEPDNSIVLTNQLTYPYAGYETDTGADSSPIA